jgi:hypothetical protein
VITSVLLIWWEESDKTSFYVLWFRRFFLGRFSRSTKQMSILIQTKVFWVFFYAFKTEYGWFFCWSEVPIKISPEVPSLSECGLRAPAIGVMQSLLHNIIPYKVVLKSGDIWKIMIVFLITNLRCISQPCLSLQISPGVVFKKKKYRTRTGLLNVHRL